MFDSVLVGVDDGQGGRDAIALTKVLAAPGARVTLAHVYGRTAGGPGAAVTVPLELEQAERLLADALDDVPGPGETALICDTSVGRGLRELAEDRGTQLLVIGATHRHLLGRTLIGDDTAAALKRAPCSVAVAPAGYANRPVQPSRIGVGYDGSPESEHALAAGQQLANRYGSTVKALSVVPRLDAAPAKPRRERERFEGEVACGEPGPGLARFSEEFDLLVIGARRRGPVSRLLSGSAAKYLARHTNCPLLALPQGGIATAA